jgi:D-3-phosphoglycerate dehydrogenase
MRIIAHDTLVKRETAAALGAELVGLQTLLRRADVVSLHVPLTEATSISSTRSACGS